MTDYVREMRKLIGHRPLILCGASVVCIDGEGRILLGKRADNRLWAYAGGALEIDEYVEECARRELYEEMGLTAEELTFFRVNCGPEAHYIYPNGDEVSNFEIVHLCRRWQGEPHSPSATISWPSRPADTIASDEASSTHSPLASNTRVAPSSAQHTQSPAM